MALHWPTFFTRLGSAIVFAVVMMAGLLWKDWAFAALVLLVLVLCLRDYMRLVSKIDGVAQRRSAVPVLVIFFIVFGLLIFQVFSTPNYFPADSPKRHVAETISGYASMVLGIVGIILASILGKYLATAKTVRQGLRPVYAVLYIVLPCFALLAIRQLHWSYPLILILCIWMNDTMAYLVGSVIGKTPFSTISPKKTWEGTAGGAILAVVGAAIAAYLIPGQSMAIYIGLSLCAAIAGTAGDLYESKLKRQAGVKDSGTMMPGHGGALDRFDSLLFAAPCAYVLLMILQLAGPV